MNKRIGFACKWINNPTEIDGMKINAVDRDLNTGSTTVRWLREHPQEGEVLTIFLPLAAKRPEEKLEEKPED